jgi:two-component system cell cycle sensor histidine kinase/response regulator CckA
MPKGAMLLPYEAIFDTLDEGVVVYDAETLDIVKINPAALNIFRKLETDQSPSFPPPEARRSPSAIERAIEARRPSLLSERQTVFRISINTQDCPALWVEVDVKHREIDSQPRLLAVIRDITREKQAEKMLKEQFQFVQTLIDAVPNPLFYKDPEGRYLGCNKAFEEYHNIPREELIGKTVFDIMPPGQAREHERIDKILLGNGKRISYEHVLHHTDGTLRHIINNKALLMKPDRTVAGIVAVLVDITKLRRSEEKYRSIFENAVEGMFQTTPDGRYLAVNPALARMFGYESPDEMMRTITNIDSQMYVNIDDRRRFKKILEVEGTTEGFEAQLRRQDGTVIWASMNARSVRDESGPVLFYEGSIENVTNRKTVELALKESEYILKATINAIQEVVILVDREGNILTTNETMAKRFKMSPEDMVGKLLFQYFPEDVAKKRKEYLLGVVETGQIARFEDSRQGTYFESYYYPVLDEQGQVGKVAIFARDITERRILQAQLLQSQKMEAIGTLAGGVAHDFNNLLMGIQGYVSLMLFNLADEHPHHDKLVNIETIVRSGSDLTRQLLGFARGGKYEVQPTDINDLVGKSSTLFGRTKKEITMHKNLEPNLYSAEVDRGQLEQVLLNLYVNAWQAMPLGGNLFLETSNIFLDASRARLHNLQPGQYVRISVTDTGIGMDQNTLGRIFEPFFTTKELGRGTGLGLASVYGIVRGHGGAIDVQSMPGEGSSFHIYLPASLRKVEEKAVTAQEPLRGKETILLVDDEETLTSVGKEILELLGYRVLVAGNGQEAVELYGGHSSEIALVILDMIMPTLGGEEVLELLKTVNPDVKVILSSGYSLNSQAQRIMEQGCRAFIQKPFDIPTLSRKIREVLDAD